MQYYDESYESDSCISKIRKRPREPKKRKIIYEDDIDGVPYEPDSPTEAEEEENDIFEVQNKSKGKQPWQIEKKKKIGKVEQHK